jgi:ATP-dependent RNA helicase SUPV3L1/SUV3
MVAGESMLTPRIEVRAGDFLDGETRERVRQRLQLFVRSEVERRLAPLFAALALPLGGAGRGLAYLLADSLGVVATADIAAPVKSLDRESRRALARLGVRFGTESVYVEPLLSREAVRFRALLWAVQHGRPVPLVPGARSRGKAIPVDPDLPVSFYAASGRRVVGGWAVRPDRLERLAAALRARAKLGRFVADDELAAVVDIPPGELRQVLLTLGYRAVIEGDAEFFVGKPRRRPPQQGQPARPPREGHPFAKLKEMRFA